MSLPPDPNTLRDDRQTPDVSKKSLRKSLLEIRKSLAASLHLDFDRAISRHILRYKEIHPFKPVGVYLPNRNEPDLSGLYTELSRKISLSLPITPARDQPLQFVRWQPGDALVKGAYNVLIPEKQEPVAMPEALLIPCVGYTSGRFRLGYGGGFFDRTLAAHPGTHTIGVAYSCLKTEFETEENDIPLHCIITETGIML